MDIGGIAGLTTGLTQAQTAENISLTVFRKALDAQATQAAALIEAVSSAPAVNLPAHLGRNINTTA